MSQHDYNIANGGGAAVRADINNALLAILSQNSGATAPTTTKPFMLWYDTANALIKMRNAADTGWIDYMNSSGQLVAPTATGLITALGGQIKFPATQNASSDANTLDDYEEGTWTPSIESDTPGTGRASTVGYATYTKIGNQVYVEFAVQLTTLGSGGSGVWVINGLPFASTNGGAVTVGQVNTLLANVTAAGGLTNNTRIIVRTANGAATNYIQNANFSTHVTTNTYFQGSCTYKVA